MKQIILKKAAAKKVLKNKPLIKSEDFIGKYETDQWAKFVDEKGNFLGNGYLSLQNKGAGWVFQPRTAKWSDEYLQQLFTIAKTSRKTYFQESKTNAFRFFNGEGDGLGGLTIDWYAGFLVISWYNSFIYHQKEQIIKNLLASDLNIKGIYEKNRFQGKNIPETAHVYGEEAPEPLIIKENNVHYATYLNEGLMTGIFLDQKEVRAQLVDGLMKGKSVLNTFSYTGAFSVAATSGGAKATTSVDLAKRSLPKTKEQFEVNDLSLENQQIYVMDVFAYFKYALKKQLQFDCIVLDPPSFARNKKQTFSVAKNYGDLVEAAEKILAPNGLLIASTNAANVSEHKFQQMIEEALQKQQRTYRLKKRFSLPGDFKVSPNYPEGNYLKVFFYQLDAK